MKKVHLSKKIKIFSENTEMIIFDNNILSYLDSHVQLKIIQKSKLCIHTIVMILSEKKCQFRLF